MKHLRTINKYFWKYKFRLSTGIFFVIVSNYFAILAPQVTSYIVDLVQQQLPGVTTPQQKASHDPLVKVFIQSLHTQGLSFPKIITLCCIVILLLALFRGLFMFFMRQTIIVMSRHIEYDQKNEIYNHYQRLDAQFYKTHSTGDLMNRITEDVSRVRMYTGPAIMYAVNLLAVITFSVVHMLNKNVELTLYVLAPLPILAITIYVVTTMINRKSERIQKLLSNLTTNAQESYAGIRVIKSFVQEKAMLGFFKRNAEEYRKNAVSLAKVEAVFFPSMALMIGLSTLLTTLIGSIYVIQHKLNVGVIVEFTMYITLLTFPVSSIGWVASMVQRAAASQKRLNEFLKIKPAICNPILREKVSLQGDIQFNNVDFVYPETGIHALKNFDLHIQKGEKMLIVGKTGSGKSTIVQLLLRMYDPTNGSIKIDGIDIRNLSLQSLRTQISYVPQDVFLFSDSITNNIKFGFQTADETLVQQSAQQASVHRDIENFPEQYKTMIGERGVTLSGGQKQRISIARGLIKTPKIIILDDCLSAVDAKTEHDIVHNLYQFLQHKTAIVVTHKIFTAFAFDKIIVLDNGAVVEIGTHSQLIQKNGLYAEWYQLQQDAL
mgnify:CR=1 FL=1